MQETSRQQGCATVLFKISDETSPVASATPGERQQQAGNNGSMAPAMLWQYAVRCVQTSKDAATASDNA
jgi:hypothetical protein